MHSCALVQVYFDSDEVHACIVTCGGLCPGLNTVIREIVCGLYHMYGVNKVLGIDVSGCTDICLGFNMFCDVEKGNSLILLL